jgi:HAE1 family hydrophobic/amphiphilic exporter-1
LPAGAQKPVLSRADVGAAPVVIYAASAPLPSDEVRRLTEDLIKPALERLEGVAKVDILGGREREIQVELDALKLESYRLAPHQVFQKLNAENATIPAGHYFTGGSGDAQEVSVRTVGEVTNPADIGNILIHASGNGQAIRVSDVATVVDGFKEQRTLIRANGQDAVAFQVVKTSGANTVAVADSVKAALASLSLPSGMEARLLIDQSSFIKENAHEVEIAIVFGGAMAILIILLFMMDLRSTFISALALPTAVVGTFLMMYAMDFTLNMLTLLGLSLAIGLLIDDAVVVRENIFRHLEMGEEPMVAAAKGTREITLAVLATTMTIVAVFVPVAFMDGIVGQFFRQFGLTVTAAVILSMWVAFTLDPMLSARLARSVHKEEEAMRKGVSGWIKRHLSAVFAANDRNYGRVLGFTVRHPIVIFVSAIGLLVGSFALAARIGVDFVSPEDRGQFIINVEFPSELSLAETSRRSEEIERRLLQDPRFHIVYATIGPDAEVNKAKYRIDVGPKWLRPEGVETLKVVARKIAEAAPEAIATAENPPMIEGLGSWFPIMVSIAGPDYAVLEPTARKVEAILRETAGAADVKMDYQAAKKEMRVLPDRELAARAGLPMALLGYNVRIAMEGEKAGQLRDRDASGHDRETDIRVRLRSSDRGSPEAIARIPLSTDARDPMTPVIANMPPPPPKVVRIGDVATIEQGLAPSRIVRENRERRIVVSASAVGRPLGDLFNDVKPRIDGIVPQGYSVEYLGNVKDMQDSNESFGMAFGLAILFIYLVLASQFESFLHPLTIMLSLPLALVGALVGLFLYGSPLSMGSQIGILLLMGLVTKNAILLIDSALVFQREGMTPREAILAAGPRRLRPILMTSAAMVLGMLPTALSNGSGSEFRAPMAIAVIGGVISSTLLTLLVVPTVYLGVEWLRGLMRRGKPAVLPEITGTAALLLALGAATLLPTRAEAAKVTLAEAYEQALKHNPDLALAAEQVRAAQVNVDRAWAYFLPQAKLQGSYTWYDEELQFEFKLPPNLAALAGDLPPTKIQESPTFQWQAQVTLPLVNLEGLAAMRASKSAVRANEHTVEAARQEVLMGVAYAYHTIAALDRAAAAAEQAKLNAKETLRVAEAQRAAETATELGVIRARTAEAEANEMAIQVKAGRDTASAALRRLTGLKGEIEVDAAPPGPTGAAGCARALGGRGPQCPRGRQGRRGAGGRRRGDGRGILGALPAGHRRAGDLLADHERGPDGAGRWRQLGPGGRVETVRRRPARGADARAREPCPQRAVVSGARRGEPARGDRQGRGGALRGDGGAGDLAAIRGPGCARTEARADRLRRRHGDEPGGQRRERAAHEGHGGPGAGRGEGRHRRAGVRQGARAHGGPATRLTGRATRARIRPHGVRTHTMALERGGRGDGLRHREPPVAVAARGRCGRARWSAGRGARHAAAAGGRRARRRRGGRHPDERGRRVLAAILGHTGAVPGRRRAGGRRAGGGDAADGRPRRGAGGPPGRVHDLGRRAGGRRTGGGRGRADGVRDGGGAGAPGVRADHAHGGRLAARPARRGVRGVGRAGGAGGRRAARGAATGDAAGCAGGRRQRGRVDGRRRRRGPAHAGDQPGALRPGRGHAAGHARGGGDGRGELAGLGRTRAAGRAGADRAAAVFGERGVPPLRRRPGRGRDAAPDPDRLAGGRGDGQRARAPGRAGDGRRVGRAIAQRSVRGACGHRPGPAGRSRPRADALSIDLDTRRIAYPALELRFEAVNGDGAAATQTLRLALDNVPGGVLRGVVFKGAAVGVEVTALPVGPDATLGAPLARGLTDADARFELVLPEYQGPLLLRAAGVPDGTSQYRDEAAPAARLTWPAEQHLDAFVPMFAPQAPAQDVTISPLTDLAVARTWAVVGEQALDAAWAESKALVAAHFDVPEFHTLRPSDVDAPAHTPPTSADRYLLALACLSTQARLLAPALRPESPSTFTPLDLVALYRADLAGDAVLDGRDGDAALGLPENALRGALAAACAHWLTDDAANVTGLRVEDVAGLLNGTLAGDTSGLFDADQPPVPFDASGPEIAEIALTSVEGHVGEAGQRGVVLVTVDAEDPAGVAALGVSLRPERPGALSQVDAAVVAHQVWRLDTTALADGPTTLVVSARDTLGNAAERTAALRIDNHAPLLRLRLNGAAVGAGAEVHTAADETVVEVEADEASDVTIALDDVPWLTRAVAPGAPLSVSAPWAVEGPARISVWGADALGNRAEALEVVVVHDASPPVLEVEPTTYVDERQLNRWPLPDDLAAAGLPRTTLDAVALASEQGVTIARQVHRWSNDTEPANPVALRLRVADAFTAPDALEVTWRRAPGQCFLLDDPQAPTRPLLTEAQPVPATEAGFELPLTAETFGFDPMSLGDAAQGRFCVEVIARDAAGNASTRTFGFQTLRVAPAVGFDAIGPLDLRGPRLADIDASTLGALLAGPEGEPVAVAGYTAHNPYPEIPLSVEFRLPPPTIEVFREPVEQWTGPFFAGFTPPECWRALDPRLDEPRTWAFLLATGDGWSCEPMASLGGPAEALPAAFGLALGAAPYAAETLVELRRGPLAPPTELTIGLWPATPDARVANLRSPRPVPELFGYPYAAVVQGPGRIAAIVLDCVQPPCDAWFEATRGERLGRVTTRLEAAQWRAVVRYGREVELNLEVGGVVDAIDRCSDSERGWSNRVSARHCDPSNFESEPSGLRGCWRARSLDAPVTTARRAPSARPGQKSPAFDAGPAGRGERGPAGQAGAPAFVCSAVEQSVRRQRPVPIGGQACVIERAGTTDPSSAEAAGALCERRRRRERGVRCARWPALHGGRGSACFPLLRPQLRPLVSTRGRVGRVPRTDPLLADGGRRLFAGRHRTGLCVSPGWDSPVARARSRGAEPRRLPRVSVLHGFVRPSRVD